MKFIWARAYPQQNEGILLSQLVLYLVECTLQTGDLHAEQGLVLVQSDQLSTLLRLQLHLQQLLLLVQELVQVAELGLDALLQVSGVLLWKMMGHYHDCFADMSIPIWLKSDFKRSNWTFDSPVVITVCVCHVCFGRRFLSPWAFWPRPRLPCRTVAPCWVQLWGNPWSCSETPDRTETQHYCTLTCFSLQIQCHIYPYKLFWSKNNRWIQIINCLHEKKKM